MPSCTHPQTGRNLACVVITAIAPRLEGDGADLSPFLDRFIPCHWCARCVEAHATDLAGVRLGRHERHVLLHAAPAPACVAEKSPGVVVAPLAPTASAAAALRRAVGKLARLGLIWRGLVDKPVPVENPRWPWHSYTKTFDYVTRVGTVTLTPLGASVVAACRAELESGRPIRWAAKRDQIAAAAPVALPELVAMLGRAAADHAAWFEQVRPHLGGIPGDAARWAVRSGHAAQRVLAATTTPSS